MRAPVILIGLIAIAPAMAETPARPSAAWAAPSPKVLPLRGAAGAKACAAYGPGFVQVDGAGTCVKLGGSVDVGVTTSSRR